jgi:hypothetical protein
MLDMAVSPMGSSTVESVAVAAGSTGIPTAQRFENRGSRP